MRVSAPGGLIVVQAEGSLIHGSVAAALLERLRVETVANDVRMQLRLAPEFVAGLLR